MTASMTACLAASHRTLLEGFRAAARDFAEAPVRSALSSLFAPSAEVRLGHPFSAMVGADAYYTQALAPLFAALPDLERRDDILIAGADGDGADWVGSGGHYVGTFVAPWLGTPPTGRPVALRYHEFWRFEDGRVVEGQGIWDLPDLMLQAAVWPMAPPLGRTWRVPGPATQDGVRRGARDAQRSDASAARVVAMLTALQRYPSEGGPEVMEMDRFWHPRMAWYGPGGIGSGLGVAGFRAMHQTPFLRAFPDRGLHRDGIRHHFFGDGPYVGVTGWPNMKQTLTGSGWLGLPATGAEVTLRSLDFWRLDGDRIRENWVLVDLMENMDQTTNT